MRTTLFTTAILTAALSAPLAGQGASAARTVGFAGGLGATYGNLVGGDFEGAKAAAGFDVNAGITWGTWQFGLGYDRTTHGHEDTDGDIVVSNVYLEPRYYFMSSTRSWTPYIAARVGRAMASFDEDFGGTSDAHGYIVGAGAGILWPLASSVQADAAAHYARLSHDYGEGDYSDSEGG